MNGDECKHGKIKYEWKMHDDTPWSTTIFDVTASEAEEAASLIMSFLDFLNVFPARPVRSRPVKKSDMSRLQNEPTRGPHV